MLYNKDWDKTETKADPFSLESLIAWAEKQPAEKEYEFWCKRCYLGQYFEAHGYRVECVGIGTITFVGDSKYTQLPPHFNSIAQDYPHTFGAALARAKAVQS